jgi:hypothetical protein
LWRVFQYTYIKILLGPLEELREWKPENEFYYKRCGNWLAGAGLEARKKFMGL